MALENDALHKLIQSLTPSEKRFVNSSFSSTDKDKPIYLKLFNWINKQSIYDEKLIKQKLQSINKSSQLPYLKTYLYESIMEKLTRLAKDENHKLKTQKHIDQAQILFSKSLYHQSLNQLKKAKALVQKFDFRSATPQINQIHLNLMRNGIDTKDLIHDGELVFKETIKTYEDAKNEVGFDLVNFKLINTYVLNYRSRNKEQKSIYDGIIKSPLLTSESKARTNYSRIKYHNIWATYHLIQKDYENNYRHSKQAFELIAQNEEVILQNPKIFIGGVYNFSKSLLFVHRFDEYEQLLQHLDATIAAYPKLFSVAHMEKHVFHSKALMQITFFAETKQYDVLHKNHLPEMVRNFHRFEQELNPQVKIHFVHQFSLINFIMQNYEQALFWNNYFLQNFKAESKSRWYQIAKIKEIILLYELNFTDLLPYSIRSTYRFVKRKDSDLLFETELLKFLKMLPSLTSNKKIKQSFQQLLKTLLDLSKKPQEDATLDFPYIQWLQHKVTNQSILQIHKTM